MAERMKYGGVDRITVDTVDDESGEVRLRVGSNRRAPFTDLGLTVAGATDLFEALGDWVMTWNPEDAEVVVPAATMELDPKVRPIIRLAYREYAYKRVQELLVNDPDMTAHMVLGMLMGEFQVAERKHPNRSEMEKNSGE
jgi:hypothetical protein